MKPIFYPSEVASLLGRNRFKPKEESLLRVLSFYPKHLYRIEAVRKLYSAVTESEIKNIIPDSVHKTLEDAISESIQTSDIASIENTIQTFKIDATKQLLKNVFDGGSVTEEFDLSVQRIKDKTSTPEQEIEKLQNTPIIQTLAQSIQKERGTRLESTSANNLSTLSGKAVTNRNTNVRYEADEYILSGSIDGQHGDNVVEIKNRKRFWKEPPEYDIIQLRCYMMMKGNKDGTLHETFPNKTTRETVVHWDQVEWNYIHRDLVSVANYISEISQEEVDRIATEVFAKMDRKVR